MFYLSWQKVDLEKVKELNRILEEAGDTRAEKGHDLLTKGAPIHHQKKYINSLFSHIRDVRIVLKQKN